MVGSVETGNASVVLTALMNEVTTRQNLQVSVIKKAQEVDQAQGEAALKLIEAAGNEQQDGHVDVYV